MTQQEKIALLEDLLEVEGGSLEPEMVLKGIAAYDSMAKLSLIVMMDEVVGKRLTGEDIQGFNTVQDILDYMD